MPKLSLGETILGFQFDHTNQTVAHLIKERIAFVINRVNELRKECTAEQDTQEHVDWVKREQDITRILNKLENTNLKIQNLIKNEKRSKNQIQ